MSRKLRYNLKWILIEDNNDFELGDLHFKLLDMVDMEDPTHNLEPHEQEALEDLADMGYVEQGQERHNEDEHFITPAGETMMASWRKAADRPIRTFDTATPEELQKLSADMKSGKGGRPFDKHMRNWEKKQLEKMKKPEGEEYD